MPKPPQRMALAMTHPACNEAHLLAFDLYLWYERAAPIAASMLPGVMLYQRQIIGYHGCLVERFEDALLRGVHPQPSSSEHDWLGRGIYFWEHGPRRAFEWAQEKARRHKRPAEDARVLGAVIQLGSCFDLLDTAATDFLGSAYGPFRAGMPESATLPSNDTPARNSEALATGDVLRRKLDRAVIEFAILMAGKSEVPIHYQTVRGAFWEGGPAFPGASIEKKSHIQVAVRDNACILGYFRPEALPTEAP